MLSSSIRQDTYILSDIVEYIPRMLKTQRGKPVLIDRDDYMYTIERMGKLSKKTAWQCRHKHLGCKARITTLNNYIIKFSNEHNHSPPPTEDN